MTYHDPNTKPVEALKASKQTTDVDGATVKYPPKRFPIDRSGIRYIARTLDVLIGLTVVYLACASFGLEVFNVTLQTALPFIAAPLAAFTGMRISGSYWFLYDEHASGHMIRTVWGAGLALLIVNLMAYVFKLGGEPRLLFHVSSILLLAYAGLHAHYIALFKALVRGGRLSENVVIIGATQAAGEVIRKNAPIKEMNILGIFDDRLDRAPPAINGVRVVGTVDDLLEWTDLTNIDRIIVAVTSTAQDRVRMMIDKIRGLPQEIILVMDLDGFAPESTSVAAISDMPAAYISGAPRDARRATLKRFSDIVLGALMLTAFSPLMFIIAIMIKLDSPGSVFFRQKRHGFNNQPIRVWKFRTMRPDKKAESGVVKQTKVNDSRITKIGGFLRRTSLDELPQLFNILAGDMSLVGPRPHPVSMTAEEVEVHNIVAEYAHRHRMKPGLTGWAQINGSRGPVHTAEEVRERVELDMEYMQRAGFWFDLYIAVMTAPRLLGDKDSIR